MSFETIHYDVPNCGGVFRKSGKGVGGRHGKSKMRHQQVLIFPAWGYDEG